MIAYVVQGNISTIIDDINDRIKKHSAYSLKIDELLKTTPILKFTEIYDCKCGTISNPNGKLKHLFFDLT
jgi:cell division protein FtsL